MLPRLFILLMLPLAAQDFTHLQIDRLAVKHRFTEGPVWSHTGNYLLFTDVPANQILKFTPSGGVEVFRENSGGANGLAFDDKGRLYICEGSARRLTRLDAKGNVEVLAERFEGKRLNGPNDVVVRRDGHVYFSDPAFGSQLDTRELPFFGVFHIAPKGELSLVWRSSTRPNGVALSPNGRVLYVANSDTRTIHAWDVDRAGNASNERIFISKIEGVPNGIKTDEKGNLYVAAAAILIYSADGKPLHRMEVSETPSNCAFGDPDLQGFYVTARSMLQHVRLTVKGAQP